MMINCFTHNCLPSSRSSSSSSSSNNNNNNNNNNNIIIIIIIIITGSLKKILGRMPNWKLPGPDLV